MPRPAMEPARRRTIPASRKGSTSQLGMRRLRRSVKVATARTIDSRPPGNRMHTRTLSSHSEEVRSVEKQFALQSSGSRGKPEFRTLGTWALRLGVHGCLQAASRSEAAHIHPLGACQTARPGVRQLLGKEPRHLAPRLLLRRVFRQALGRCLGEQQRQIGDWAGDKVVTPDASCAQARGWGAALSLFARIRGRRLHPPGGEIERTSSKRQPAIQRGGRVSRSCIAKTLVPSRSFTSGYSTVT